MRKRGAFTGVWAIVQFNWPYYAAAGVVLSMATCGLLLAPWMLAKIACALAMAGCLWFFVGSLGASHLVYDRSDMYHGRWLGRVIGNSAPRRCVLCHSGFDDISPILRELLPGTRWRILDHYDPALMTEPSIHRARRIYPPTMDTVSAKFDAWPASTEKADLILGLLAIHELRTHDELAAWSREAKRRLATGGRIVIAEHLRNAANFFAFGPGFLHFHSRATWQRAWEAAGLQLGDEFSVTPFIRFFVLKSS